MLPAARTGRAVFTFCRWNFRMSADLMSPISGPLATGSAGPDVLRLQQRLNDLGEGQRLNPDGKFGPRTRARLIEVQRVLRLNGDGVFAQETAMRLGFSQYRQGPAAAPAGNSQTAAVIAALREASMVLARRSSEFYRRIPGVPPSGLGRLEQAVQTAIRELTALVGAAARYTLDHIKQAIAAIMQTMFKSMTAVYATVLRMLPDARLYEAVMRTIQSAITTVARKIASWVEIALTRANPVAALRRVIDEFFADLSRIRFG
jgi:peptidoglycan hydrolase-like protein with peptidoglycan-binding domain